MELKDLSLVELKALAYDQLALLERTQQNLQIINKELNGRMTPAAPAEEVVSEPEQEN